MMMIEVAPAKINLALHVRRRRPDGYHELETLFAFARDGDMVSMVPAERWSLTVTGPYGGDLLSSVSPLAAGTRTLGTRAFAEEADLVQRATNRFTAIFPETPPQAITLDKRLPIASGIGGGSADAAATLRALARIVDVSLDDPRLTAIARPLGADVPACLLGRTSFGSGVGEELAPIDGVSNMPLLLVNPGVAVSTASVFRAWDGIDRGPIHDGALLDRARAGRNDLAPPARALAPVIGEVEAMLADQRGVMLSRMSGSGATCFALFKDQAACDEAAARARARGWWAMASCLA